MVRVLLTGFLAAGFVSTSAAGAFSTLVLVGSTLADSTFGAGSAFGVVVALGVTGASFVTLGAGFAFLACRATSTSSRFCAK